MIYSNRQQIDHKDQRVETFESAVDLFTLLSFVMIFASIMFGVYYPDRSKPRDIPETVFRNVTVGSGVITDVPKKTIVLIIGSEESLDVVSLIVGGKPMKIIYRPGDIDIETALNSEIVAFQRVEDIHLVLFERNMQAEYKLFVAVQKWLANHHFTATVNFYQG